MALLTCKDLSLGYDGVCIADGVDFAVEAGDYLCVVGENGSGKSTLMKTILGLQPPLGGSVVTGDGLKRNEIGYLPQQTEVQKDFPASVREIVLSGRGNSMGLRPFYNKEDKRIACDNMEKLGLTPLAKRCYRELSGGQQQRVLLARALCATRKMLLLDEPVSAEMYSIIERLNRDEGIAVIMISHDVAAAVRYAGKVLHIGKSVFFGTTREYLESPAASGFLKGGDA